MLTTDGNPAARLLTGRPLGTALVFVLVGILPLYLTSAQVVSLQAALDFGPAKLGIATALHFGLAAAAARPIGAIVARLGARRGLQAGSFLVILAGITAVLARDWWPLLVVATLGGLANGFMQVSTNVFLAADAPFHRQGVSFGAKQGAISLGAALAGALLPAMGVTLGWRWSYGFAAALATASIAFAPRLLNPPAESRRDAASRAPLSTSLRWLAVGGFCGGAAGNSLALFVVPSAVQVGLDEAAAGSFLAWSAALVFVFRTGAGWFADRRRSSGHREMAVMLGVGGIASVILAATDSIGPYLGAMPLAMIGSWGWAGLVYFTVVRIHPEAPARASSVILAGNLTGTMLGPLAVGLLADRGAFGVAWTMTAVLSAVASTAMLLSMAAHRRMNRDAPTST